MRTCLLLFLGLALLAPVGCGGKGEPTRLRLATTTSTENSGLLDWLLPPFEERENVRIERIAVGTGQALALGERGDADVVLVHARTREDEFVAQGFGVDRRDVMWNDFLIVGPAGDPAGVRGMQDAAAALQKIAAAKARFVSRGDDSGTHIREKNLWKAGGGRPEWDDYILAGQGMGPCLTIADEKQAYVLTDRGTYIAYGRKVDLEALVEGDTALRNPYGVILVNPERHPDVKAAIGRKLIDYLTSPEGQKRIADYRKEGQVLFHPQRVD